LNIYKGAGAQGRRSTSEKIPSWEGLGWVYFKGATAQRQFMWNPLLGGAGVGLF